MNVLARPYNSHRGMRSKCGSRPAGARGIAGETSPNAHHNPDFNRLNARINARLNALPLSFLLYSEALTAAVG